MRTNPLQHNDAPGGTRTPNLLIRSHYRLSDAGLQVHRDTPLTRDVFGPEDAPKRPYPAKKLPLPFPRLRVLLAAAIVIAILVVLSI